MREAASAVDDERAARARELLATKAPDVDALSLLAAGATVIDDGPLVVLGQLSALTVPGADAVTETATALQDAADQLQAVQASADGDAADTADLLAAAVAHTAAHDGGTCPVCGTVGVIDDGWRARTEAEIQRLRTSSQAVKEARGQVETALRAAVAKTVIARTGSSVSVSECRIGRVRIRGTGPGGAVVVAPPMLEAAVGKVATGCRPLGGPKRSPHDYSSSPPAPRERGPLGAPTEDDRVGGRTGG